jgi:hypothetical protein
VSEPRDNVEVLAEAVRALNARDLETIQRLTAPDFEWRPAITVGGALEQSVYRGPDGVARYMEDLDEVFVNTQIEPVGFETPAPQSRGRLRDP